jgi:hypothetical protein
MTSDRDPAAGTGGVEEPRFAGDEEQPLDAPSTSGEQHPYDRGADPEAPSAPAEPLDTEVSEPADTSGQTAPNMLPGRERRRSALERLFVRLVATGGVIAIGVGIAAILADNKVQGWIIGLVISVVTVVLSAILWSSRQL